MLHNATMMQYFMDEFSEKVNGINIIQMYD